MKSEINPVGPVNGARNENPLLFKYKGIIFFAKFN